jgi:pantoate kinase
VKLGRAYSPAGISSVFEIVDREPNGTAISNPLRVGARGGGFVISKGIETEVRVEKNRKDSISVNLNGQLTKEALTTETVTRMILRRAGVHARVSINHRIEPPVGCGYGTSAAGSLSAALALCQALGLDMTYNQIGQMTHVAEVKCKTGLGTVGAIMLGGHVVTVRAGAPAFSVIDRIRVDPSYRIVTGWFGPISTQAVLSNQTIRSRINKNGRCAIEGILRKPTTQNFFAMCRKFAYKTGFMTERMQRLLSIMESSGAIGATQNMVGEAGHALVEENRERRVCEAARRILHRSRVFSTTIDFQGARPI